MKKEERDPAIIVNKGKKIFAVVHRPISEKPYPMIIICSGFAGSKCGKNRLFVRLAEHLASLGMGVLRFDYRGCGDSEGNFQDQSFEDYVSDALACLNYVENHLNTDKTRIGFLGRSLGGAISIIAAVRSKKIKSLALWAPLFSSEPWKRLWQIHKTGSTSNEEQKKVQRFSNSMPSSVFLKEFFELNMENEIKKLDRIPLLHIEAKKDEIVSEEHTVLYRKTRENSNKTKFLSLPTSNHDFDNVEEQEIAIKATCDWFLETL